MILKKYKNIFSLTVFCGLLCVLSSVNAQEITNDENQGIIESSEPTVLPPIPSYTWADFLTNKDCRPLIKELASYSQYNELYQNLRASCMEEKPQAWEDLLNTFRKEKRKLLFNQIMNSDTSYAKYFKVVPFLLFDIQNTKPENNQLTSILDKTQQAIIDHQLDTALALINDLPDEWKNDLKNTQVLIKRFLQLKEQLEVLAASEQEGQND